MAKTKRGRPKKWTSPTKMQKKIDEYFEKCEGIPLENPDGTPVRDKYGQIIYRNRRPPTITGLACYLGIESRSTFLEYQKDPDFAYTITTAKTRVEAYLEERLMDRDGQRGAEFNLRCNYGWNDKGTETQTDKEHGVILIAPVLQEKEEEEEKDESGIE